MSIAEICWWLGCLALVWGCRDLLVRQGWSAPEIAALFVAAPLVVPGGILYVLLRRAANLIRRKRQ